MVVITLYKGDISFSMEVRWANVASIVEKYVAQGWLYHVPMVEDEDWVR